MTIQRQNNTEIFNTYKLDPGLDKYGTFDTVKIDKSYKLRYANRSAMLELLKYQNYMLMNS